MVILGIPLTPFETAVKNALAPYKEAADVGPFVGDIKPWPGDPLAVPVGWLIIDGRIISSTTYPDLARVLGTRYKLSTDPAGTIRLPATPTGIWPAMTWVIKA